MLGSFYRIDRGICTTLHLKGSEAMVYSALLYLCKNAPYTGSYTELADFSLCGGRMTAKRSVSALIQRGLIIENAEGISIAQNEQSNAQNEQSDAQNERPNAQNVQFLREITKENMKIKRVWEITRTRAR